MDDQQIDRLRENIRQEHERIKLDQELLAETRRQRVAEQARIRLLEEAFRKYVNLAEQVSGLVQLNRLHLEQMPSLAAFHEAIEDISEEIELIWRWLDRILELLRFAVVHTEHNGKKAELQQILDKLDREPRLAGIQKQLKQYRRNLSALREQQANYGMAPPLELVNQIEYAEAQIHRLAEEFSQLDGG